MVPQLEMAKIDMICAKGHIDDAMVSLEQNNHKLALHFLGLAIKSIAAAILNVTVR